MHQVNFAGNRKYVLFYAPDPLPGGPPARVCLEDLNTVARTEFPDTPEEHLEISVVGDGFILQIKPSLFHLK